MKNTVIILFFFCITLGQLSAQEKENNSILTNSIHIFNFNDNLFLGIPYLFFDQKKVEKYDGDDMGETYFTSFEFKKIIVNLKSTIGLQYSTSIWTKSIGGPEFTFIDISSLTLKYDKLPLQQSSYLNRFYGGVDLSLELRTQQKSISFAAYQQEIVHQIKNNDPDFIYSSFKQYAGALNFTIGREILIKKNWITNLSVSTQFKFGDQQIRNESNFTSYFDLHYGKGPTTTHQLTPTNKWEAKVLYFSFNIDTKNEKAIILGSKIYRNISLYNCNGQIGIGLFFPLKINEFEYAEVFDKKDLKKEFNFTVDIAFHF